MDLLELGPFVLATSGLLVAILGWVELARRRPTLRRPLLASSLAGFALWLGGTLLLQALAPTPLPELSLRRLDGSDQPLRSFEGKPLVINLWASWCPPCRREMPALEAMQAMRPDVHFVFVNQGEPADRVDAYLAARGLDMANVLVDPAGQLATHTRSKGLPITLFYDAQGVLRLRHEGELSEATLREKLAALTP